MTKTKAKKPKTPDTTIVRNKKALHDFFIEETFEAGLVLEGWEVKALRQKKVQLVDSYVLVRQGEAWLLGCNITPLSTASSHVVHDPSRTRKLLLHRKELAKIFSKTQQAGHTCVALKLYWKGQLVKCQVALAKGKQKHDKRATEKQREWNLEKQRILRHHNK